MKRINKALFSLITISSSLYTTKNEYSIVVQTEWQNLQRDKQLIKKFGGKWMLAGSITFKKKSKQSVDLEKMHLHWHGKPIDHLNASLYKKTPEKNFIPVEQNLLCDSCWNKKNQTLIFNFNKKQNLGLENVYYLVLTIPKELKDTLKSGHFTIQECCLPETYKQCTLGQNITLNISKEKIIKSSSTHD